MRVLLTGANGFIGGYLLAALERGGHSVVPAVRNPAAMDRVAGEARSVQADFNRDVTPEIWLPRLAGVDAVVNCAGVLQGGHGQSIEAIHACGPIALFQACEHAGVRRVIQISAISAEPGAGTDYAQSKLVADEWLKASALDWVILRPSLVYAAGAYGGSALFRALSALPYVLMLPGRGEALFSPIHIGDLADTVLMALSTGAMTHKVIDPVGPDTLPLRDILIALRGWLGLTPAAIVEIPMPVIHTAARFGDVLGGPLNTTALRQMAFGNAGPVGPFTAATGIVPRSFAEGLRTQPAQVQDRWHARLYFLRPALRLTLAAVWLISALAGILHAAELTAMVAPWLGDGAAPFVWVTSLLDILVACLVLTRWRAGLVCALQILIVITYTLALTVLDATLWLAPFGPLIKNLPILVAITILGAIEPER